MAISTTNPRFNTVEVPKEVFHNVLSFVGVQGLGRCACVSKGWKDLSCDDHFFKELFRRTFREEPSREIAGKVAFCKRLTQVPVKDKQELERLVTCFICNVKWETKRRLECEFPNDPNYALVVEQGFGPNRGTLQGFESSPAEQTEYVSYQGESLVEKYWMGADLNNIVGYCIEQGKEKPFEQRIYNSLTRTASLNMLGTPCYQSSFICQERNALSNYICPISDLKTTPICVNGLDVGYGNTLGVCSNINNWEKPFKFLCMSKSTWFGIVPFSHCFKFVKINKKREITWEKNGFSELKNQYNFNRAIPDPRHYDAKPEYVIVSGKDIKFPK
jgi:hypothetical protein